MQIRDQSRYELDRLMSDFRARDSDVRYRRRYCRCQRRETSPCSASAPNSVLVGWRNPARPQMPDIAELVAEKARQEQRVGEFQSCACRSFKRKPMPIGSGQPDVNPPAAPSWDVGFLNLRFASLPKRKRHEAGEEGSMLAAKESSVSPPEAARRPARFITQAKPAMVSSFSFCRPYRSR